MPGERLLNVQPEDLNPYPYLRILLPSKMTDFLEWDSEDFCWKSNSFVLHILVRYAWTCVTRSKWTLKRLVAYRPILTHDLRGICLCIRCIKYIVQMAHALHCTALAECTSFSYTHKLWSWSMYKIGIFAYLRRKWDHDSCILYKNINTLGIDCLVQGANAKEETVASDRPYFNPLP